MGSKTAFETFDVVTSFYLQTVCEVLLKIIERFPYMGVPPMDFFHGKSHLEMDDDWGSPYDSGNLHLLIIMSALGQAECTERAWTSMSMCGTSIVSPFMEHAV